LKKKKKKNTTWGVFQTVNMDSNQPPTKVVSGEFGHLWPKQI